MSKVTTFITFKERGAEAVEFYTSLFENSKVHWIHKSGANGPMPEGALMHAKFEIDGQQFMAMDGGPSFTAGPGFSMFASAETQAEIDRLWDALLADGGLPNQCGWLTDKFGICWQIVPPILGELLIGPDKERSGRVVQAMLKMNKMIIKELEET